MLLTLMLIDFLRLDSLTNSANVVFVKVASFELSNEMFFELVDIYTKFDLMLTMLILSDEVFVDMLVEIWTMFLLMLLVLWLMLTAFVLILLVFKLMLETLTLTIE